MNNHDTDPKERTDTDTNDHEADGDVDTRDRRALTEYLTVLPAAPDLYTVVSQSGKAYAVDARSGACTFPDAEYREPAGGCKHARRVAFATGERSIPDGIPPENVDELLGIHVHADDHDHDRDTDAGAVAVTDGGECEACAALPGDFPCADCYVHGRVPLPEGDG